MSRVLHSEIMALNNTGKTFALRLAADIYFLTCFERLNCQGITNIQFLFITRTKFPKLTTRLDIGFSKMTGIGFVDSGSFYAAFGNLDG